MILIQNLFGFLYIQIVNRAQTPGDFHEPI